MVFVPPSDLQLYGVGVPPYSARGITQTLAPIAQAGNIVRAIAGNLLDLSYSPFRKYKSTITCNDQKPPAVSGVWPGKVVTVHCVAELVYDEYGSADRSEVPGSLYMEGGFWHYRPILVMRVMSFQTDTDEWNAGVSWSMELEED
jgi:hypothetical protein